MSVVAGIDPSLTSTGVAILRDGKPILLRSVGTEPEIKSDIQRLRRVFRQTGKIKRTIEDKAMPDLLVIEKPLTFGNNGTADGYDRHLLYGEICRQFDAWKVPIVFVNNQTRAVWATGHGHSRDQNRQQRKREVLEAVRATWHPWAGHITNDDIADALCLAEIGARGSGDQLHFQPWRRHIEAMHNSITWPSGFGPKPETTQVGAVQ